MFRPRARAAAVKERRFRAGEAEAVPGARAGSRRGAEGGGLARYLRCRNRRSRVGREAQQQPFPDDFPFSPKGLEFEHLKCQIGISRQWEAAAPVFLDFRGRLWLQWAIRRSV